MKKEGGRRRAPESGRKARERKGEVIHSPKGSPYWEFQETLGYFFRDEHLLQGALKHSSLLSKGHTGHSFDRLEFLGDRVLNMLIARRLYESFLTESEGDLSHRYTALVCYETCVEIARQIGLDRYLEAAPGTIFADFKILGDAVEALLGAMFLDGGLEPCQVFVDAHWHERLLSPAHPPQDGKSALQERVQALGKPLPIYEVLGKSGTEHEPVYTVQVQVEGVPPAIGKGSSKKMAEKKAAEALLSVLEADDA